MSGNDSDHVAKVDKVDSKVITDNNGLAPALSHDESADHFLESLGYKPELARNRSTAQVAFMSFVLASIPYGLATTLAYPLAGGGPVDIIWGWVLVSAIIVCVAASLGEITSVYPTAGGMYIFPLFLIVFANLFLQVSITKLSCSRLLNGAVSPVGSVAGSTLSVTSPLLWQSTLEQLSSLLDVSISLPMQMAMVYSKQQLIRSSSSSWPLPSSPMPFLHLVTSGYHFLT